MDGGHKWEAGMNERQARMRGGLEWEVGTNGRWARVGGRHE